MKKRICILLSVLLILPTVLSFSVSAESTPSLETLVSAANDADMFANLLHYEYLSVVYDVVNNRDSYPKLRKFANDNGYVDESILTKDSYITVDQTTLGYQFSLDYPYFPFGEKLDTMEEAEREMLTYFLSNKYALIPHPKTNDSPHIVEVDGRLYGTSRGMGKFYSALWETTEIVKATSDKATIAFAIVDGYGDPVYGKFTVALEKHHGRWLVSGGTYFGLMYGVPYVGEEKDALEQSLRSLATEFDEELAKTKTRIATPSWSMKEEYGHLHWDLIDLTPTTAIVACNCRFSSDFNHGPYTMEFAKTSDGWQVSGGSYFEVAYEEEIIFPPAQTGDSAVYALWSIGVSFLAIGTLLHRKKKI